MSARRVGAEHAPLEGVSIRDFARREGCDEKVVRRKLASGHLKALPNGKLDPALVGTAWRERRAADPQIADRARADNADSADLAQEAERRVLSGQVFDSEAEAKRHKESFLAHLRELEYDRESGQVAEIADVAAAAAAMCAVIRNNFLGLPAKAAPRLAVMRSAEEIKDFLEAEITKILEDLTLDGGGALGSTELHDAIRARFAAAR